MMETTLANFLGFLTPVKGSVKEKQDLLRYLRVIHSLIRILQVPFKQPREFPNISGFNQNGIDINDLNLFPRLKSICRLTYEILAKVAPLPL